MAPPLILIADDPRDDLEFLEQVVLTPAGYRVRSVGDGLSALTLARELLPDLVITDLQMPGLQGLDLVRRLRLARPRDHAVGARAPGARGGGGAAGRPGLAPGEKRAARSPPLGGHPRASAA